MNKIRVIDLLNKIANGEEVPKKILYKYQNKDFYEEYRLKWNKKYEAYYTTKDNIPITHLLADNLWNLNDEVEIIEDEKIYKLDWVEDNTFNRIQETSYLSKKEIELLDSNFKELGNKINEIIDYLQSKGE